ncbi:MAG: hybrid sensor histidine kinase/response regulator [Chloroflexi bacterium]|nr:MAG: hybrid sensor histidine kinase/response regulator [Chloroflexota bacterium]
MTNHESRILIVDDNESVRDLLSARLERRGYQVETAENGKIALERMRQQEFHLILLDIMMPEMNGYQVLEAIQNDDHLKNIPVVVLSALNDMNSVVKCVELGAEDYLFKPINSSLLWARINASLEKKHYHDQEKAHMEELTVMQKIDRELNTTLDVDRAVQISLKWAVEQSGTNYGFAGTVSAESETLAVLTSVGRDDLVGEQISFSRLGISDNCQLVQAAIGDDEESFFPGMAYRVLVPIWRQDTVNALIVLEGKRPFSDKALQFLSRLSDHAAIAITNAQLYQAVQAASKAKSDFVSLVSHELKNPMTSILSYTDLIKRGAGGEINEKQARFLDVIRANVQRMIGLVSDLDDISRIEAGQFSLEIGEVSLAEAVHEVLLSLQQQIAEKELQVTVNIDSNLPLLKADKARLLQILTNLVSNACKYTPPGGSFNVCGHVTQTEEGPMAEVVVQDTGIGIPEAEQKLVFSQFFRSEDRQVREISGTGLGLNITRKLVELHGGRIWFESVYGKGTTFFFTMPLATVPNQVKES